MPGPGGAPLFGPSDVEMEKRADGSILLRSPHPLQPYGRAATDWLDKWAAATPDRTYLAQRDAKGTWCHVTFAGARALARNIAQALLDRGLTAERPVAILSGNGLEHALIGHGAMYAGIPFSSVSPAYSLISSDFAKLKHIVRQLTPGLVFAVNGTPFGKAIAAAVPADVEVVVVDGQPADRPATPLASLWDTPATAAVDAAHAKIGPDTVAKVLFTSGSTGVPKGVINTQRMLTSNQAMIAQAFPCLAAEPPVLLDWLPWSHTFGGNHNLGIVLSNGGTLYIDDGKPLPGAIEETVRNLREIATTAYFNVPKGFEMLLPYLRAEPELRKRVFSRLKLLFYAGAGLAPHVWQEFEKLAVETTGHAIPFVTSLGSTETAPSAISVSEAARAPGVIGIPNAGVELKLVPNGGKLEARIKGPLITPGYWREPALTEKAFDVEGFYLLGDAMRLVDPEDTRKGLIFDGRIAEDFKLATGTWVSVGPLRARFISHFAPLVRDVVIAGHDEDFATALVIPDVDALRAAASALPANATLDDLLSNAGVRTRFSSLLVSFNKEGGGSSGRLERLILMSEPPSIDKGEMTDKGSINQRAVLEHRAALVAELYAQKTSARTILPAKS